jgi:antitoxin ParD1/3/4
MEVPINTYYIQIIQNVIKTGKYSSESEVIQAGLELLDREQKQITILEKAILDGEKSGFSLPFDNDAFKTKMKEKYAKQ